MITPRFHLTQSERTFTITIRAPYCSLKELDVQVDEETFLFYCKPYYLRLTLPGRIEEERNAHSEFNADSGEFTFTYEKVNHGETFANLEFITKFLSPKLEVLENGRKIEVLSSSAPPEEIIEGEDQYGFAQRGGYAYNMVESECCDVFALNPHEIPLKERKALRLNSEKIAFNVDHYLADFIECDEIESLLQEVSPWRAKVQKGTDLKQTFTNEELDFLKDLPNITHELSSTQVQYAFTSLVDILYAYCYDKRSTCFDSSCESGWTILKLSASLHWFDAFETPKEAILSGFRRALMFPLYRNFQLCSAVLEDLKNLLELGETEIIKALIDLFNIFLGGDSARYILNHLFIKDYVIYIQKWDAKKWQEVVAEVNSLQVTKSELDLNLETIEDVINERNGDADDDLTKTMKNLSIFRESNNLDSDDDESDSDYDSTGSEESDSE